MCTVCVSKFQMASFGICGEYRAAIVRIVETQIETCKVTVRGLKGLVHGHALLDPDDYARIGHRPMYARYATQKQKAAGIFYVLCQDETKKLRQLSHLIHGPPKQGCVIDHINNDPRDNRRRNLREVSFGDNAHNKAKRSNTASQYIGVDYNKVRKKWRAHLSRKRSLYLGAYDTELEAAKARDRAAVQLYGTEARLNNVLTEEEIREASVQSLRPVKRQRQDTTVPEGVDRLATGFSARWVDGFGVKQSRFTRTMDEAVSVRTAGMESRLNEKKAHSIAQLEHNKSPITRNANGQAVIITNQTSGTQREVLVDEAYWACFNQHGWSWAPCARVPSGNINNTTVAMHIFAWNLYHPDQPIPKGMQIDHKYSHLDDCRSESLQLVDAKTNAQNKPKRTQGDNRTSKFTGVTKHGEHSWTAIVGGEYQGSFYTQEAAALAYNKRASELYPDGLQNQLTEDEMAIALQPRPVVAIGRKHRASSSQYLGVCFDKKKQRWLCSYARKFGGYFCTHEEAARAHDALAIRMGTKKPPLRLNFLPIDQQTTTTSATTSETPACL